MKHEAEIYSIQGWLLLGMLICIILAACTDSKSSSGTMPALPPKVEQAIALVPDRYEVMPIVVVKAPHNTGINQQGVFSIRDTYIDLSTPEFLACAIVHETVHIEQGLVAPNQVNELEAIKVQIACMYEIGGADYEIEHLKRQNGLHYINQNYRDKKP